MLNTVLFDMGGTLEDIWYNDETRALVVTRLMETLRAGGLEPGDAAFFLPRLAAFAVKRGAQSAAPPQAYAAQLKKSGPEAEQKPGKGQQKQGGRAPGKPAQQGVAPAQPAGKIFRDQIPHRALLFAGFATIYARLLPKQNPKPAKRRRVDCSGGILVV